MSRKSMRDLSERRRRWVNEEYAKIVSGTHMSNKKKTSVMKKLWREAKRRYKRNSKSG